MLENILSELRMTDENTPIFRPVRCLQEDIDSRPPQDGFLYFTIDTRKIYYGTATEYKMMGGSSGIFYGNKILTPSEKDPSITTLEFYLSEIDGNNQVAVDDLILNIPDGGFYRVISVSDTSMYASRIAIAGGGGSGGGGEGTSGNGTLRLSSSVSRDFTILLNTDFYLDFTVTAFDALGELTPNSGTAILYVNNVEQERKAVQNNTTSNFNVGPYIKNAQDSYSFTVKVILNAGGAVDLEQYLTWSGKGASLRLDWDYSYENAFVDGDSFYLQWTPYGSTGCTTYIVFDNKYNEATTITVSANAMNNVQQRSFSKLSHGAHTIEMWLETTVSGIKFETERIKNEIACIDPNDNSDFLMVPYYKTEMTQYDTINIPYYVYTANTTTSVQYYINDKEQLEPGGISATSEALNSWPCTITDIGNVKLKIALVNGKASKEIDMVVAALDLSDLGSDIPPAFELRASAFANDDALKTWKIKDSIGLTFSDNFDWDNGGIKTETVDGFLRSYICVKNGSRMTINYPLFANGDGYGKEFKIIFKTANCQDYKAKFLDCSMTLGDKTYGIEMNAQETIFGTTAGTLYTNYAEHSYIEYEAEIWPNGSKDRYIMTWVDGVPNGVAAYTSYDFNYHTNNIIIGSDDCDVHIYLVKAYETNLSISNHMRNFIMDAPNSSEIMKRYNRNNILDNNEISWQKLVKQNPGCHAYLYDVEAMPYEKSKTNRPLIYKFEDYVDTIEKPRFQAENAEMRVQGTSSAAYGLGAFNLDTKFKNGVLDGDGNPVDGYVIADGAIPVDYTCTKVNVASCENANNALNQEWYNRFQPYHDAHRREGEALGLNRRDCMQFNNGVVFVKDHNPNVILNMEGSDTAEINTSILHSNVFFDTVGYDPANPYYKQYAIGNMGNSKDNVEIFHSVDDPACACVEIPDNNNDYYLMKIVIPEDDYEIFVDEDDNSPEYEFRFPDGNDEASDFQKKAWIRFVRWMALRNPVGIYQEKEDGSYEVLKVPTEAEIAKAIVENRESEYEQFKLDTAESFDAYTFRGFAPPYNVSYSEVENIDEADFSNFKVSADYDHYKKESLIEGYTINTYAGTYNYNTVEYRMAKMLSECEDYLVMDSILYHYLFIEAHTMIDNVAKNTFWSTEDGLHWDLTKNYDNDTADGIDNNGRLRFDYGLEPFYMNENGEIEDSVFNADQSVWLQFVGRLTGACRHMYTELSKDGENNPWNYKAYLQMFKDFQNVIPERVWVEDYIKKYIRPHRLYEQNTAFLSKLEGGKKTSQRESYEKYQNLFLSSKYTSAAETTSADRFYIRVETKEDFNRESTLTLKYYIDCYTNAYVAKQVLPKRRIKRGEEVIVPVGRYLSANTTENIINIPNANIIQELTGISGVYPAQAELHDGTKLNGIQIGSEVQGYINSSLNILTIPAGELLEELNVANITNSGLKELDLSTNTNLKTFIATGSAFPRFNFCKNGLLETLKLNAVNTLELDGYTSLKTFTYDNGIYNNLLTLNISNCNDYVMGNISYNLAMNTINPALNYQFIGIKWNSPITEADHIPVLDKLLTHNPITKNHRSSLTGQITVDNSSIQVDEYEMYRNYSKQYPNVIIKYTTESNLTPAKELTFLKEEGSDVVVYRVLTNGEQYVQDLINGGENSPLEQGIDTPYKDATSANTYTFTGYWIDENGQKYYNTKDWFGEMAPDENAQSFETFKAVKDMVFYPEYQPAVRKYGVTFRDYDTSLIYQNGEEFLLVPYGSPYSSVANAPMKNYYYREPDESLATNERYAFKGWTLIPYGDMNSTDIEYFNLATEPITKAITLYAHYGVEDCTKVASNSEYFLFTNNGTTISVNPEYANELKGKISLPATSPDGVPITTIGSFNTMINVTHLFFLADTITTISNSAFGGSQGLSPLKLVGLYWKEGIKTIGTGAFQRLVPELSDLVVLDSIESIGDFGFEDCSKLAWTKLPANLQILGVGAFMGCSSLAVEEIPPKLTDLGNYAFSECTNLMVSKIPNGTANGTFKVGYRTFNNAGQNVQELFIPRYVEFKFNSNDQEGFRNYGAYGMNVYLPCMLSDLEPQGMISRGLLGFRDDVQIEESWSEWEPY